MSVTVTAFGFKLLINCLLIYHSFEKVALLHDVSYMIQINILTLKKRIQIDIQLLAKYQFVFHFIQYYFY